MALRDQTVAIAVIGVTGSGKTTFINQASGSNLPVSKTLGGCTTELNSSTFSLDGRTVTLIDTPGFGDTAPSVLSVLKLISDYFPGLYSQGVKLAGVIFMHGSAEGCTDGPSKRGFRIFHKFCGDSTLRDVLIVANMGHKEEHMDSESSQSTHKDEFFGPAVDKGARMLRHDGSQASAHAILRHLIHRGPPAQEGSTEWKEPVRTPASAGSVRKLTGQVEHHAKEFGELCQGIDASTSSKDREILQDKAKDSLEKIERIRHDLEQMVTTIATEKSRLEDENRRYKNDFSAQRVEAEFRTRMLEGERKARELAEAQLAEERALWERQKMEKEHLLRERAGTQYGRLVACGALMFAMFCVSRLVFHDSNFLPL